MVIVRRANLMNRVLLSCLDSLRGNRIDGSHNKSNTKRTKNCDYDHTKTHALAFAKTRFASLTGGYSTLVRHFQPFNWSNDRTSRRLVRHLVDDLGNQQRNVIGKGMNKVIEANFLPRGTNADFFWPPSIGGSGMK